MQRMHWRLRSVICTRRRRRRALQRPRAQDEPRLQAASVCCCCAQRLTLRGASFWHNHLYMPRRKLRVLAVWLMSCLAIFPSQILAQEAVPTVTFTFDFPGSDPEHYVIKVAQDGHTSYTSNKKSEDGDSDSFNYDFMLQAPTTSRIFDLTKRAKYFEGDVDLKKKNLASTGVKILAYQDAERSHQTTYNFSMVQPVQELTQIFQNLATSMEFGRRLEYYHK